MTENVHKLLSIGGFILLVPVSEGANAIIYFAEGDNESALMSAFATIPGMKVVAVAKGAIKLVPETEAVAKFVQAYTKEVKAGENAADVAKGSGKVLNLSDELAKSGVKYNHDGHFMTVVSVLFVTSLLLSMTRR